jgi:hypothetical protein
VSLPPVVAVSWNVEKGANLPAAAAWLHEVGPDVFFMQELQSGQGEIITELTGMTGHVAAPTAKSSNFTAVFLRPGGPLVFDEEYPHPEALWLSPANITVRLRGSDGVLSPRRISLVSAHLCYCSTGIRLLEAQWMTTLAKPGWLAMVFGDWNSYRTGEGGPWDGYADKAFVANRTRRAPDGSRVSDDEPDRAMTDAGYVELARRPPRPARRHAAHLRLPRPPRTPHRSAAVHH